MAAKTVHSVIAQATTDIQYYFHHNNSSMALRSCLLTLDLPDASGKTVPYYTYDGYLEEHDRHKIHAEKRSLEQLAVTGSAVVGLLAFVVCSLPSRQLEDLLFPSSRSGAWRSPSLDCFLGQWAPSSALRCSACTAAAGSHPSRESVSLRQNTFLSGRTSEMQSIPTALTSSLPMNVIMNP